jgi:hypothetical protein
MMIMTVIMSVVTWLRRLVAVLLPRKLGLNSKPVHMKIAAGKVALGKFIFSVLQRFPISAIPPVLHNYGFIEQ